MKQFDFLIQELIFKQIYLDLNQLALLIILMVPVMPYVGMYYFFNFAL